MRMGGCARMPSAYWAEWEVACVEAQAVGEMEQRLRRRAGSGLACWASTWQRVLQTRDWAWRIDGCYSSWTDAVLPHEHGRKREGDAG